MSRNNTGNPIGSKAFPDFEDNVKNLDEAVNTDDPQWVDRFGRFRLPLMEQERQFVSDQERREGEFQADQSSREAVFSDFLQASGYQDLGEYAPGIEITAHNQYVTFGGQPYTLKPSIPVPYTTSGGWTGAEFKLIGDDSLRQDLANPDKGAAMVARGVVAVDSIADLQALPEGMRKEGLRYLIASYHGDWATANPFVGPRGGGEFAWTGEDASSLVANDPFHGLFVPPSSDYSGESGVFVRIYTGSLNPEWFGARPRMDDFATIVNSAAQLGDILTPQGEWWVAERITIPDNRAFHGEGRNTVFVKRDTTINISGIVFGADCTWGNFTFDGNFRNYTNRPMNDILNGSSLVPGPRNAVSWIWAFDSESSHIASSNGAGTTVDHFHGGDYLDHAIYFSTDCRDIKLRNIFSRSAGGREPIKFRRNIQNVEVNGFDLGAAGGAYAFSLEVGDSDYAGTVKIRNGVTRCRYFIVCPANSSSPKVLELVDVSGVDVHSTVTTMDDVRSLIESAGGDTRGFAEFKFRGGSVTNALPHQSVVIGNNSVSKRLRMSISNADFISTIGRMPSVSYSIGDISTAKDGSAELVLDNVSLTPDFALGTIRAQDNATVRIKNSQGVGGSYGVDIRGSAKEVSIIDSRLSDLTLAAPVSVNDIAPGSIVGLVDLTGCVARGSPNYGPVRGDTSVIETLMDEGATLLQFNERHRGTSAQRPNFPIVVRIGFPYFDTTLGVPIYWGGTSGWVKSDGSSA